VLLWASGMGLVPSLIYGFMGKAGHRSDEAPPESGVDAPLSMNGGDSPGSPSLRHRPVR